MSALFRISFSKISTSDLFAPNICNLRVFQRGIKGHLLRNIAPQIAKPAPYPYREKKYNKFNSFFDKTTSRMDENSKLIVVEGPVASGKTKFAKALADDLGMYHMPEANLDMFLTNDYGFNFKKCDDQLPEDCRSFDVKDFLLNPKHRHSAKFQLSQYVVKYSQYIDALAHLFSTGQGVILERCVYSDFVFIEAMVKLGYISKAVSSFYYDVRNNTLFELLRPHLIIYLDVSVDKIMEKVKQRNIPAEVQSQVINPTYLQVIEDKYKQNYLKEISTHSELLVYDWSEDGDVEVVVEDIERLEFKREDEHDPKLADWVFEFEEDWAVARNLYTDRKDETMELFNIPRYDVPELMIDGEDSKALNDVYFESPGNLYHYGYNSKMGDSGIFFKLGLRHRETLPLIERKIE